MAQVTVTAAANTAPSFDFSSFDFTQVTVLSASDTQVVLASGVHVLRFQGVLGYDGAGNLTPTSTVHSFELFHDSSLLISATDLMLTSAQIAASSFAELLQVGLAGDDSYTSHWNGGERIITFDGNDTIRAGSGDDTIFGGAGIDSFVITPNLPGYSFAFNDIVGATVTTSEGRDMLFGVEILKIGGQTLHLREGSDGDDLLTSSITAPRGMRDMIHGRDGDDTITGGAGQDFLIGGAGHDRIAGGSNHDLIEGGFGDDTLIGNSGRDVVRGDHGADLLLAGNGRDHLLGGAGSDTLDGGRGRDHLDGGADADLLRAGQGNDTVLGNAGDDTLMGNNGRDVLRGDGGDDLILGGRGADTLFGSDGADRLIGQTGNDRLTGGSHADTFVFSRGHGHDTITDFRIGEDMIEITRGANGLQQLGFLEQGSDVRISFANVSILVENVTLSDLMDADNFLF